MDKSSLASVSEQMDASQCLTRASRNQAHFSFHLLGVCLDETRAHNEHSQDANARAALDTKGDGDAEENVLQEL